MVGSTSTAAAGGGGGAAGTKKRERKKGIEGRESGVEGNPGGRGRGRAREKGGRDARGVGEKDAGVAGKGAAPATNFRARGHCGAGAWLRRRSKRKIDAVHRDEKQRARRDGGPAGKKKRGRLRGPERGRKMRAAAPGEEGDSAPRRGGPRNPLSRKSSPLFLSLALFPDPSALPSSPSLLRSFSASDRRPPSHSCLWYLPRSSVPLSSR